MKKPRFCADILYKESRNLIPNPIILPKSSPTHLEFFVENLEPTVQKWRFAKSIKTTKKTINIFHKYLINI